MLREFLAPWTGNPYDFEIWSRLGVFMQSLQNPYTNLPYYSGVSFLPNPTTGSISYPPLSAFLFALAYRLYLVLGAPSRFLYYFLLKQPMVISDVSIAAILFRIVLDSRGPGSARTVSLTWLYFPLGILVSAVWGSLDPIALALTLLAAYHFLNRKLATSASLLGLGIFVKTIPIVTLPVFLMQRELDWTKRLEYLAISLSIPIAGTMAPIVLLNWGFSGFFDNSSFQAAVPVYGGMSILSALTFLPSTPLQLHLATEVLWFPSLLSALVYVRLRRLSLFPGLLVTIFGFSLFRPFLSEQWSIYPLALLLPMWNRENVEHYLGLTVSAMTFFVVNNMFLVVLLYPLSPDLFNWAAMVNSIPSYVEFRLYALPLLSTLFFVEAFLAITGRRSLVYRVLGWTWTGLQSRVLHLARLDVTSFQVKNNEV